MKIICAWCKKDMGEKPPLDDERVTHTICPECILDFDKERSDGREEE